MRLANRFCWCVLLSCLLLPITSLGCSIPEGAPSKFDPSEYIFIGEVVDFAGPLLAKDVYGEAWGIVVKLEGEVYLPRTPTNHFEVFPYGTAPDCSNVGWTKEAIIKHHPIGSKLRVIATEAKPNAGELDNGNIRLATPYIYGRGISRAFKQDSAASVKSVYDYRKHESEWAVLPFETRKDLLRLSRAKSEDERVSILERVIYNPYWMDYAKLVENHISDIAVRQALIKRREAMK